MILGTAAYMAPGAGAGQGRSTSAPTSGRSASCCTRCSRASALVRRARRHRRSLAAVLREEIDWTALPPATPPQSDGCSSAVSSGIRKRRLRDIGEARITLGATTRDETPAAISGTSSGRSGARALPWAAAAIAIAVAAWALWQTLPNGAVSRDLVHLDIVSPAKVEPVAIRQGGIAISPDGKSLAMVGVRNGQRRLFVRRLDAVEVLDLAATSGGGTVFAGWPQRRVHQQLDAVDAHLTRRWSARDNYIGRQVGLRRQPGLGSDARLLHPRRLAVARSGRRRRAPGARVAGQVTG